jgi:hypothetical protein
VPGGDQNAAGTNSFATGHRAKAMYRGSFVWADSNDFDFSSTITNGFSSRSSDGVSFVSGNDDHGGVTAGVRVNAGSNAWTTLSDRESKTNVATVDPRSDGRQGAGVRATTAVPS